MPRRSTAAGHFVLPGLVNAHMHTWQTALRSVAANWTLLEYFRHVHAGLATVFTPEDIHIATLAGALNQLDHGVTTLVDWCHNNPTPEHTDAAIAGLKESGIRAAFFHGSPKPDPKPGEPQFSEVPHPRQEVERLLKGPLSDRNALGDAGHGGARPALLDARRQRSTTSRWPGSSAWSPRCTRAAARPRRRAAGRP